MYFTNPRAIAIRAKIMNCVKNSKQPLNITQIHRSINGKHYVQTHGFVNYLYNQGRLHRIPMGNAILIVPA